MLFEYTEIHPSRRLDRVQSVSAYIKQTIRDFHQITIAMIDDSNPFLLELSETIIR